MPTNRFEDSSDSETESIHSETSVAEDEEMVEEAQQPIAEQVTPHAQGWPSVSEIEPLLSQTEISEARKKSVKSLYGTFVMSENEEDVTSRPKTELLKVITVSTHVKKNPTSNYMDKMRGVLNKCIELCPEKKKRMTSVERKSASGTSTPSSSLSLSEKETSVFSATATVGVDVTKTAKEGTSDTSKKRKPKFEVSETKKKKMADKDFFSSKTFNGFDIKGHPGIIPRRVDKAPIDKQMDIWMAIDKDTKMAVFEKTWVNEKTTNKVYALRMLRRYKKKNSEEGAVYTFDIPLENLPIMVDQLQQVKQGFEKIRPKWFDEVMAKRKAIIEEMEQNSQHLDDADSD